MTCNTYDGRFPFCLVMCVCVCVHAIEQALYTYHKFKFINATQGKIS